MNQELTRHVAFLRGINVGGHRKIPMADLRALAEDLFPGAAAVTYIASGNLCFSADVSATALSDVLEQGIKDRFGFEVAVLVLTAAQLDQIVADCPWPDAEGNRVFAYLCFAEPKLDFARTAALIAESEELKVTGQTVWLHAPDGVGRSRLAAKLEGLLGVEATSRNWNTIKKMRDLAIKK